MAEKPDVNSFCELFDNNKRFIIKWGISPYQHCKNSKHIYLPQIHAYPSHFFQRYKERCLKDKTLSTNDVICRYFARNDKDFFPIKITNEINNNIEKYGIAGEIGCIVTDGFCFTQSKLEGTPGENRVDDKIDAMLLIYATFISKNEMGKNQYEAIKAGEETALSHLKDFYEKNKICFSPVARKILNSYFENITLDKVDKDFAGYIKDKRKAKAQWSEFMKIKDTRFEWFDDYSREVNDINYKKINVLRSRDV